MKRDSLTQRAARAAYRAVRLDKADPLRAQPWVRIGYMLGWKAGYLARQREEKA